MIEGPERFDGLASSNDLPAHGKPHQGTASVSDRSMLSQSIVFLSGARSPYHHMGGGVIMANLTAQATSSDHRRNHQY